MSLVSKEIVQLESLLKILETINHELSELNIDISQNSSNYYETSMNFSRRRIFIAFNHFKASKSKINLLDLVW